MVKIFHDFCESVPVLQRISKSVPVLQKSGHLAVLQWAHDEERCPWDKVTCDSAARAGHLEVLRWASTNGCPLEERTSGGVAYSGICWQAARGGHLDVLRWAREQGCPWAGAYTRSLLSST